MDEGEHFFGPAEVAKQIQEIRETRIRYGYRRLYILLERKGREVNWKKLYRIYREERKREGNPVG